MEELPQILTTLLDQSPFVGLLSFFIWALYKRHVVLGWYWQEKVDESKKLTELLTESTKINGRAVMLAEQNVEEIKKLRGCIDEIQEAIGQNAEALSNLGRKTRAIDLESRE